MRLLSIIEKKICDKIQERSGRNNFLGNIIDSDLQGVCINIGRNPNTVHLEFTIQNTVPTKEEQERVIKRADELSVFILQILNLLKMLEKDGYILLLERGSNSTEPQKFGGCIGNLPFISYQFNDQNIVNLLCEYSNKEIYSTEEFERFCKNGHIPRDEQRFLTQIRYTRIALKFTQIALCITILALCINTYFNIKEKPTQKIKLEKNQFDSIQKSIVEIKSTIVPTKENKLNNKHDKSQKNNTSH